MTTETDLAQLLIEAQRDGSRSVDQGLFAGIDRSTAYRVQAAVMHGLGKTPAMFKVAVAPDGGGAIAPIYAGRVGQSGKIKLPSSSTGLEVEIGVVIGVDLPPGSDRAAVEAAVSRYFMGIEICGTRFVDRQSANFDAGLADNISALGYALDPSDWERGTDLADLDVEVSFNGAGVFAGPARHPFGGVLEAVVAYAKLTEQPYPLLAGTVLTTGSLCGLVPVNGPGKGVARLGEHTVEVELD